MGLRATIGLRGEYQSALMTDDHRVVRRIGYAVHRYCTGLEVKDHGARYVLELRDGEEWPFTLAGPSPFNTRSLDHADWTWFAPPYPSLSACLEHCLDGWHEELYVVAFREPMKDIRPKDGVFVVAQSYTGEAMYRSVHGNSLHAASGAIIRSLREYGAIEETGRTLGSSDGWLLDVALLDSWVAAALIQLEGEA